MAAILNVDTKQEILEGAFAYFTECGLENSTIRDLVKHIKITEGTVYYWYKNKDELVCAAAEYGLAKLSDDIFEYFFKNTHDIDFFFDNCLKSIDYVKKDLRFIYQTAASPVYGEIMRQSNHKFTYSYENYAKRLAKVSGGDIEEIQPLIHLFGSCIVDYAVWQNEKEAQIQLDYIRKMLKQALSAKENN